MDSGILDSNTFYRIRKRFEGREDVESIDWESIRNLPKYLPESWKVDVRGQEVTSYRPGEGCLVVFDNREGKYTYCTNSFVAYSLGEELVIRGGEPLEYFNDRKQELLGGFSTLDWEDEENSL